MDGQVKFTILDTDFVSKANIIKADDRVLADEVLAFPGYRFFCHQKMKDELGDHGTRAAQGWLDVKISEKRIICYSDERILSEMMEQVGNQCYIYYRSFLRQGCNLFRAGFYEEYFLTLDEIIRADGIEAGKFLDVLKTCEDRIGHQQSYGEVKAYVLSQALKLLYDVEAYIFCSDDYGARQGFANGAAIPCISILSVFLKLKLIGHSREQVEPFFQSFIQWCSDRQNPQTHVRVWEFIDGSDKRIKVPLASFLSDIYDGLYKARKDGDLLRINIHK